jgi:hypothetical protein
MLAAAATTHHHPKVGWALLWLEPLLLLLLLLLWMWCRRHVDSQHPWLKRRGPNSRTSATLLLLLLLLLLRSEFRNSARNCRSLDRKHARGHVYRFQLVTKTRPTFQISYHGSLFKLATTGGLFKLATTGGLQRAHWMQHDTRSHEPSKLEQNASRELVNKQSQDANYWVKLCQSTAAGCCKEWV